MTQYWAANHATANERMANHVKQAALDNKLLVGLGQLAGQEREQGPDLRGGRQRKRAMHN